MQKTFCVVSGQEEHVNAFEKKLQDKGIVTRQLHTSHAFHSYMMEPMLEAFHQFVEQVELHEPTIPFISNVTGTWATSEEVMTASYWTNHLRGTVRFHAGLSQLFTDEVRAFIEVGPGNSLTALAKRHENKESHHEVLNMVRHAREQADDHAYFLKRIGELWAGGYEVKTQQSPTQEERQLVSLPTYPFERKRYWIEAGKPASPPQLSAPKETKKKEMGEWFYLPSWEQQPLEPVFEKETEEQTWLIFREQNAFHELFTQSFNQQGIKAISVTKGEAYQEQGQSFTINPAEGQHYRNMLDSLSNKGVNITRILHLWEAAKEDDIASRQTAFQAHFEKGYYSLIFLSQAIAAQKNIRECRLFTVTSGIQPVTGHETICVQRKCNAWTIKSFHGIPPYQMLEYRCGRRARHDVLEGTNTCRSHCAGNHAAWKGPACGVSQSSTLGAELQTYAAAKKRWPSEDDQTKWRVSHHRWIRRHRICSIKDAGERRKCASLFNRKNGFAAKR